MINKMFTSVPGPSWPNHQFAQSATSCGTSSNVMYNRCGGKSVQFPQMTIYDSLHMAGVDFGIYVRVNRLFLGVNRLCIMAGVDFGIYIRVKGKKGRCVYMYMCVFVVLT